MEAGCRGGVGGGGSNGRDHPNLVSCTLVHLRPHLKTSLKSIHRERQNALVPETVVAEVGAGLTVPLSTKGEGFHQHKN